MAIEKAKLSVKLAKIQPNQQLLAQTVKVYLSNQRSAHAKTKSRGEVQKTTAKMYKQKGTGRARHGAYSAPTFVGGGLAFGPRGDQNYDRKLSKSQTKIAILSALSSKKGEIWTISELEKMKGTKEANKQLMELKGKILVILGTKELKFGKFFGNLVRVTVTNSGNMNAYQILRNKQLLFTENSLEEVTKKYVD